MRRAALLLFFAASPAAAAEPLNPDAFTAFAAPGQFTAFPDAPKVQPAPPVVPMTPGDRLEERDFRGWRVLVRCATPGGEGILVKPLYPLGTPGVVSTPRPFQPAPGTPDGSRATVALPAASPPVRLTFGRELFPGGIATPARGVRRLGGTLNPFSNCPPSG